MPIAWTIVAVLWIEPGLNHPAEVVQRGERQSVATLIRQLASPAWQARETAERQLINLGPAALPAIERHSEEHSEIGARSVRVAFQIQRNALVSAAKRAADGDVAAARQLPMWSRFRIGDLSDQERARQLGQMILVAAESDAYLDLDGDPNLSYSERRSAKTSQVFRHLSDLQYPYFEREKRIRGAMAAMLYGGHPDNVLFPEDGMTLRLLLSKADAKQATSARRKTMHWLLEHYVANLPNEGKVFALPTVLDYQLPNTAQMCRIVLEHGNSPGDLAQAASVLALSGEADDVEILRPLFDRKDLIRSGFGSSYQRLGPIALLSAILLSKQDPADYGYSNVSPTPVAAFNYLEVKCPSRMSYDKILEKWQEWETSSARDEFPAPRQAIHGARL